MTYKHNKILPVTERDIPTAPPFIQAELFLQEAGLNSERTERTYRAGLRAFADWLQHSGRSGYEMEMPWPLSPAPLQTADVLYFRSWLLANKSQTTARTYLAAVVSFLNFLDGLDQGPPGVQLGKLAQQRKRRRIEQSQAATVVDKDEARQDMPAVVAYYDELPLLLENDRYNRRLSLLRDRALVNVLYSTAARLSEVLALNRTQVGNGRSQTATITGKGGYARTLHLMPYAQSAIQAYLAERLDSNPALFISHSRNAQGARLSQSGAHNVIKRAVKAQELEPTLSAHDFRHYRATQLLREGMPLEVVQEYLGHVDVSTTRSIYAPVLGVRIVREWLDNLDARPDFKESVE
ncbi:MAG: tyrosine-type recombinase/integrase [Ardenticatenaceae bacterium]|nr:tyrosine-type recombinase/integrase [Ardenticatenaceae bacterium]